MSLQTIILSENGVDLEGGTAVMCWCVWPAGKLPYCCDPDEKSQGHGPVSSLHSQPVSAGCSGRSDAVFE